MASKDMTAASLGNKGSTQGHEVATTEQRATEDLSAPVGDLDQLSTDDPQTITSSSAHDPPSETMRANFPLPRELRDHIYSYLLDSKHTRIKRAHFGDRAYKFHTSILGVNRQMHDEAEEYLYKHNVFVVISHQFLNSDFIGFAAQAPWVARLQGVGFVHSMLDVNVSDTLEPFDIPRSSWIFLSQDLDSYCQVALAVMGSRLKATLKLIIDDNDSLLDYTVQGDELNPDHMGIAFRSDRYRKTSFELQASLLAPLRTLMRSNLRVSVYGDVLDHALARNLGVSTESNLACISAISWNSLEGLGCIKATADVSALAGEPEVAASLYEGVVITLEILTDNSPWQVSGFKYPLYSFYVSTLLTKTNLHKQTKDFTGFARTVARLLDVVGDALDEDRGAVASFIFHQHMLAVTVSPSEESLPAFTHVTIAECIERLSVHNSDLQAHDVAILKMCADREKMFTPEDLPAASCSFFAKTSRMRCFGQPVSKPDHIIGFVDVLQLRNLDKRTKEQINKLQGERGWHVTRFEDYDEVDSLSGAA